MVAPWDRKNTTVKETAFFISSTFIPELPGSSVVVYVNNNYISFTSQGLQYTAGVYTQPHSKGDDICFELEYI